LSYRVLIVDDEQDVLDVLGEMVNALGFRTSKASCGIKAIELLKNAKYDLVITDLIMPDVSGIEVLQAVKKQYPTMPVIITAGVDIRETQIDLKKYGKSVFIKKPFTLGDISESIRGLFKDSAVPV